MADRLELLLKAVAKNELVENWDSLNRLEKYLACIMTSDNNKLKELGTPLNRLEELLVLCFNEETAEDEMIRKLEAIAADYTKTLEVSGGNVEDKLSENIAAYNKEGITNLEEKGISLSEDATTQTIIQSIADIEVSKVTDDGAGNASIISSKVIDNGGDIIIN
jgi:hypothetical protein